MAAKSANVAEIGTPGLTPAKSKAAHLIFAGHSVQEAADAIGKHRQTVSGWLNHDQPFKDLIADLQTEEAEEVRFLLASTHAFMIKNLKRLAVEGTEATQLRATQFYLEKYAPPTDGLTFRTAEEAALIRQVISAREKDESEGAA